MTLDEERNVIFSPNFLRVISRSVCPLFRQSLRRFVEFFSLNESLFSYAQSC